MNLTAKILNSDALLNSWKEIGSVDFIPGSAKTIVLRLFDLEEDLRFVPSDAGGGPTLSLTFTKTDGTSLVKAATILNAADRSMWTVSLTATETSDLFGGDILFDLTEDPGGTPILTKGVIPNALRNMSLTC